MGSAQEKMGVGDSVAVSLKRGRVIGEKNSARVNVHVVLSDEHGNVKYEERGENLVTDHGDNWIAARLYDNAQDIVTGMRLGTGVTAVAKSGAGGAIVTYKTGTNVALDAAATDATKGAGLGWRTTFVTTWVAGVGTDAALAEVVMTDETPLTDVAGAVGNTPARYVFGATINKAAGDVLTVTWQVDVLGA